MFWINLYPSKRMEQVTVRSISVRYERSDYFTELIKERKLQELKEKKEQEKAEIERMEKYLEKNSIDLRLDLRKEKTDEKI